MLKQYLMKQYLKLKNNKSWWKKITLCKYYFNQKIYRYTVLIFCLIITVVLSFLYGEFPSVRPFLLENSIAIFTIVVSVLVILMDNRARTRARIELMLLDKAIRDEFGQIQYNVYLLRIKNIGINSASNVSVDVDYSFDDQDDWILKPFKYVDGFDTIKASCKLLKGKRYIAGGESLDIPLFVYTYLKHKNNIECIDKVTLTAEITFIDERSGVKYRAYRSIHFLQFLEPKLELTSDKKPILKQILDEVKRLNSKLPEAYQSKFSFNQLLDKFHGLDYLNKNRKNH